MQLNRTLFYLLLAINLVLAILSGMSLAGIQPPWQPVGEAERLKRQMSPEKITLLPDAPTPEASAPQATAHAPAAEASAVADSTSAAAAPSAVCVAYTNLGNDDIDQLNKLTGPLGDEVKLQINGQQPSSYWVNIPPSGGRDGANHRGEILAKAGITDFIIVREAGPSQYAISLGLFRKEEAAKRLVEQLQKKNIKSMRITARDNTGKAARAEIRGMGTVVQALQTSIAARIQSAQPGECGGTN